MADSRGKQRAGHDRPLQREPKGAGAGHGPPGGGPSEDVEAGLAPPADLQKRVEELERERDEYLDNLKRVAADFENYRKRAARDQASLVTRAHERLVKELLPVLDDLERALQAAEEHEEAKLEEGVDLVARSLREALAREGLVEIETDGRFDPHVHEALLSQPSEEEEGAVIEVLQKGYRLGDRVLRPARVVVSQGTPQEA
jgi:molecular chaperone GrpE